MSLRQEAVLAVGALLLCYGGFLVFVLWAMGLL